MKYPFKYLLILVFLLVFIQVEAQGLEDAIGFTDDVTDAPAAPIHMLIPIALTIGALFGIKNLK